MTEQSNWTLVKYTYDGDHKIFIDTFEGTENECRFYAENIKEGKLVLLDPQNREWEL